MEEFKIIQFSQQIKLNQFLNSVQFAIILLIPHNFLSLKDITSNKLLYHVSTTHNKNNNYEYDADLVNLFNGIYNLPNRNNINDKNENYNDEYFIK